MPGISLHSPLTLLLLQLLIILAAAKVSGYLFKKLGQPSVIGEIVAGIALGPSLLGYLAPHLSETLFSKTSVGPLQQLSGIGVILFLFIIGAELNVDLVKQRAGKAIFISQAGILIPFALGAALAWPMYATYAPAGVSFYVFALFCGIALSITAFPVLASIIRERGLLHTRLGALALTCAAVDDVLAWCLLAFIMALAKGSAGGSLIYSLLYAAGYIAIMAGVVRPVLALIMKRPAARALPVPYISLLLGVLIFSALATEIIGLHSLFGAFIAGLILPKSPELRAAIIHKTEALTLGLLLPLFFAATGLRTDIHSLTTPAHWLWCGIIIIAAVTGKLGGCSVAARLSGGKLARQPGHRRSDEYPRIDAARGAHDRL